jgi:hypothetical protein
LLSISSSNFIFKVLKLKVTLKLNGKIYVVVRNERIFEPREKDVADLKSQDAY